MTIVPPCSADPGASAPQTGWADQGPDLWMSLSVRRSDS